MRHVTTSRRKLGLSDLASEDARMASRGAAARALRVESCRRLPPGLH